LLRVLQQGQVERLGSTRLVDVDVRVIAATNRDLGEELRHGRFRRDLYYRLNVFPITLPALRDRRDDIGQLVRHIVSRYGRAFGRRIEVIPPAVINRLESYDWPGNIRELENVIQRAIILSGSSTLSLCEEWPERLDATPIGESMTMVEVERRHIIGVLQRSSWRIEGVGGAARVLGMKPSTLRTRMSKLGIVRAGVMHQNRGVSDGLGLEPGTLSAN
jgi:transcriptional regulator with GAF, ATPase, and Fis domain